MAGWKNLRTKTQERIDGRMIELLDVGWVVGESVSEESEDVLKLNSNWTPGFKENHGDHMDENPSKVLM